MPGDGREFLRQLVADGRLGEDVFTTYLGHAQQGPRFEVSDLALHNTAEAGYWMAIGGAVFDVGEFVHLHIGGPHIIRNHVGLDATAAYRKVLHHAHAEIDAQLAMYQIGHLRRLQFGARWGVVLTEDGLHALPLEELFRTWVRFVYLLVGMENALTADYGFTTSVTTPGRGLPGADPVQGAVRPRGAPAVPGQLPGRAGARGPAHPVAAAPSASATRTRTSGPSTPTWPPCPARPDVALVRRHPSPRSRSCCCAGDDLGRVAALCRTYAHVDVQLLRDLKTAVLEGIRAFETHEADVVERAGATLLRRGAQARSPRSRTYYQRLAEQTRGHGITADGAVEETIPVDRGLPGHGGPLLLPD